VGAMVVINAVVATLMVSFGWAISPVDLTSTGVVLAVTIIIAVILDRLKVRYYMDTRNQKAFLNS
jgi:hypothetical protein